MTSQVSTLSTSEHFLVNEHMNYCISKHFEKNSRTLNLLMQVPEV